MMSEYSEGGVKSMHLTLHSPKMYRIVTALARPTYFVT